MDGSLEPPTNKVVSKASHLYHESSYFTAVSGFTPRAFACYCTNKRTNPPTPFRQNKMSTAPIPRIPIIMDDPSEYRPETRNKEDFRDFRMHTVPERVINVYKAMHANQTYAFAKGKLDEWGLLNHAEMTIMEALDALNNFVDECDPDVDIPNAMHAFQTAEGKV